MFLPPATYTETQSHPCTNTHTDTQQEYILRPSNVGLSQDAAATSRQESFDETIGVLPITQRAENSRTNKGEQQEVQVSSAKPETVESQDYILTPVSHLLSDVLSSVNSKSSTNSTSTNSYRTEKTSKVVGLEEASACKNSKVHLNRVKDTDMVPVDMTRSPSLFSEDDERKEDCLATEKVVDKDIRLEKAADTSDVIITKMKKVHFFNKFYRRMLCLV